MRGICLNWKVVAGLAAVGVGVWALAPETVGAALSVLALLACPLSMLFMMRGGAQQGGAACAMPAQKATPQETAEPLRVAHGGSRAERLAALKAELAQSRERQDDIARRIAALELDEAAPVREAEAVARSADRR